jgi:signal transduction histidine kinase
VLRGALIAHVDDVAEARASDIGAAARDGDLSPSLPGTGDDGIVVQVVDDQGRVLSATDPLRGAGPISTLRPSTAEPVDRTFHAAAVAGGHASRLTAQRAESPAGPVTVYVATSLEAVDDAIRRLEVALLVGGPLLLLLVMVLTWRIVGRALEPVEAIRAEVADISDRSLDRRVPVPASGDEIGRLAETMNTMLERLDASSSRQRRFVADASHELQTPLATTRTTLEVALAHPERTDWDVMARDLLDVTGRMEGLVQDLLYLARTDAGAADRRMALVDLDVVVREEVARARQSARVAVDGSAVSAAAVRGRADDLARVVRNLLDNAIRHATTTVRVSLQVDGGGATLVVDDDGPGVPVCERERIFERFRRLDDVRNREAGGTGLGLAIAKDIVASHGGTISAEDGAAGARFVVHLPGA